MSDARTRELERRAGEGDASARQELRRLWERSGDLERHLRALALVGVLPPSFLETLLTGGCLLPFVPGQGRDVDGDVCGHCGGDGCRAGCTSGVCQCGTGRADLVAIVAAADRS